MNVTQNGHKAQNWSRQTSISWMHATLSSTNLAVSSSRWSPPAAAIHQWLYYWLTRCQLIQVLSGMPIATLTTTMIWIVSCTCARRGWRELVILYWCWCMLWLISRQVCLSLLEFNRGFSCDLISSQFCKLSCSQSPCCFHLYMERYW